MSPLLLPCSRAANQEWESESKRILLLWELRDKWLLLICVRRRRKLSVYALKKLGLAPHSYPPTNICFPVRLYTCSVPVELFISKEAVTAERRYEKERHSVKLHACKLHLVYKDEFVLSSPCPPPPPLTPASNKCDKGGHFLPPLPHPRTPHCWIGTVFSDLGQKRGWPPLRGSKVLQLNLDSFCDHVRIFGAVIGHL
jgi:hypothetical protein